MICFVVGSVMWFSVQKVSSKKIRIDHAKKAIGKLDGFSINDVDELEGETKLILDIIKESDGSKIGDLFKTY